VGLGQCRTEQGDGRPGRRYSPAQLEAIDRGVRDIFHEAQQRSAAILAENRTLVETLRDLLLEHKVIDSKALAFACGVGGLMTPRPLRPGNPADADNDRDARKILADLLEEQGSAGWREWARGQQPEAPAAGVAMMLLPCRAAIGGGGLCRTRIHRPGRRGALRVRGRARQTVARVEVPDAEMAALGQAFMPKCRTRELARRTRNTGVRNADTEGRFGRSSRRSSAVNAEQAAAAQTGSTPRHFESMTLLHLRAIARAAGSQALPAGAYCGRPHRPKSTGRSNKPNNSSTSSPRGAPM
jgi:hypothetical protein